MEGNSKQTIVERIKNSTNILVTVSRNPSVDELAAALALTLMLNKLDKHATAVFSGEIPSAINFLEPDKTFESTVDSLRDFIIALDKEKADRLRYKVEDDVVRIFITPYQTTITQNDLDFSQGDFNVELIIALGVEKKDDLDNAISAHGRILHDATIVTINTRNEISSVGSVDWTDASASCLCEMLMSLSEALKSGLLDEQIASSLLTGIVAATERFSNQQTSPKVMTMAAQLMAAGANQQLIAAKLEEGHALPPVSYLPQVETDGTKKLKEGSSEKIGSQYADKLKDAAPENTAPRVDGEMHITHDLPAPHPEYQEDTPKFIDEPAYEAEPTYDQTPPPATQFHAAPVAPTLSVSDMQKDLEAATREMDVAASGATPQAPFPQNEHDNEPRISKAKGSDWHGTIIDPPSMGGTLSATATDAESAKHAEDRSGSNHTILSHDGPSNGSQSINALPGNQEPPTIDPFAEPMRYEETTPAQPLYSAQRTIQPTGAPTQTLADLEAQAHANAQHAVPMASSLDSARAAVDAALGTPQAPQPAPVVPQGFGVPAQELPPLPPMPDFSSLPPLPSENPQPPHPGLPPMPQFPQQFPETKGPHDPGQFKIPGQ